MSGGLADIFSGGADSNAANDLEAALTNLQGIGVPSAASLTLPQLAQYVQAGILTPDQAQAYTVNQNALQGVTADNSGLSTELSTIGQLQDIVNAGGNDPEEQANIQSILNTLGTTEAGNNAAILRNNAATGTSNSGFTEAEQLANNSNEAGTANSNALNAAADAEARNLSALSSEGTLGGAVQGQEYSAAASTANAQNAIDQFNAEQKQQVGNLNTTEANTAQAANIAAAQQVENANVQSQQLQEESVPEAQQQAYEDALAKASGETGIAEAQANQATQTGQQNAGILGGLIGTAGTVTAAEMSGDPYAALASALAQQQNSTPNTNVNTDTPPPVNQVATGGRIMPHGIERPKQPALNMKAGGPVPGRAVVPGDSPANDTQLAKLSPGEIVLPRSVTQSGPGAGQVAPDPNKVMSFLKSLPKPQSRPSIHPRAVLDTLRGLSMHHAGAS